MACNFPRALCPASPLHRAAASRQTSPPPSSSSLPPSLCDADAPLQSPADGLTSAQMDGCKKKNKGGTSAAADLTDDLIVEILSRLPAKSICRFKSVSRHWYGLITHPEHRKKIPQTLSGFFHDSLRFWLDNERLKIMPGFVNMMEGEELPFSDSSLPFVTGYRSIIPKVCCNGLLFCLCWEEPPRDDKADFIVCNPATEKWVVLPEPDTDFIPLSYLFGFDPAISPHFHVFQILDGDEDFGYIDGVNIYSSETGTWSYKGHGWGEELQLVRSRDVFLNGIMHLLTYDFKILTVDTEGKKWRTIPLLESMCAENFGRNLLPSNLSFIGQSQGQLYYINMTQRDLSILAVWVLEDYDSDEWIFKYNISTSQVFGENGLSFEQDYGLIAIHPECNLVYFVWKCEDILMSYDMDQGKVSVICDIKEHLFESFLPYLPYVPFLSGSARLEA